jgi:ribosomal protein S18 acetylase RimI-like enzyme
MQERVRRRPTDLHVVRSERESCSLWRAAARLLGMEEQVSSVIWGVRPVEATEFDAWSGLFRGYCDFYEWLTSDEHQRQIWSWIHDERRIEALVAIPVDEAGRELGPPVGLAHLPERVRPLRGVISGYLDDLFVDPHVRGKGAVDALFAELNRLAIERGWDVIRWTTADNNYRARGTYDKIATRTTWITYDMTPRHP